MTRTTLRSCDVNRRPQAGYIPTPHDVAAWLDENPDLIPSVHACCRATSQWKHSHGVVMRQRLSDDRTVAAAVFDPLDQNPTWRWWAGLGDEKTEGTAETRAGACEAMDLVLTRLRRVLPAEVTP